jgi:hypothetical protein
MANDADQQKILGIFCGIEIVVACNAGSYNARPIFVQGPDCGRLQRIDLDRGLLREDERLG